MEKIEGIIQQCEAQQTDVTMGPEIVILVDGQIHAEGRLFSRHHIQLRIHLSGPRIAKYIDSVRTSVPMLFHDMLGKAITVLIEGSASAENYIAARIRDALIPADVKSIQLQCRGYGHLDNQYLDYIEVNISCTGEGLNDLIEHYLYGGSEVTSGKVKEIFLLRRKPLSILLPKL